MDRRHFIHVATGACVGVAQTVLASGVPGIDAPRRLPRFGLVTVGGIGCCILGDGSLSLPYSIRTIAINTDAAGLASVRADRKVLVGPGIESERPAHPEAAAQLARTALQPMLDSLAGLDLVFVIAGMGGTAGTGLAPVAAQALRAQGAVTLAYAVLPFDWEGERRRDTARSGVRTLQPHVDALITVSNSRFAQAAGDDAMMDAVLQLAPRDFLQCCRRAMDSAAAPFAASAGASRLAGIEAIWV